jgi:hypothetical protein
MTEPTKCPICGETAPEPAALCIPRLIRKAKPNQPCDYSREGEARFAAEIGEEKAALIERMSS